MVRVLSVTIAARIAWRCSWLVGWRLVTVRGWGISISSGLVVWVRVSSIVVLPFWNQADNCWTIVGDTCVSFHSNEAHILLAVVSIGRRLFVSAVRFTFNLLDLGEFRYFGFVWFVRIAVVRWTLRVSRRSLVTVTFVGNWSLVLNIKNKIKSVVIQRTCSDSKTIAYVLKFCGWRSIVTGHVAFAIIDVSWWAVFLRCSVRSRCIRSWLVTLVSRLVAWSWIVGWCLICWLIVWLVRWIMLRETDSINMFIDIMIRSIISTQESQSRERCLFLWWLISVTVCWSRILRRAGNWELATNSGFYVLVAFILVGVVKNVPITESNSELMEWLVFNTGSQGQNVVTMNNGSLT